GGAPGDGRRHPQRGESRACPPGRRRDGDAVTAGDAGPRPVTDVDTQLRDAIASVYKVRWIVLFAGAMLLVGAVAYLGSLAFSQQAQISAAQKLARNQQQQIRSQQAQLQSSCS